MTQINLLPWREEARERQKTEFFAKLGVVALVGLVVAALWVMSTQSAVDHQRERNAYLKQNIAEMDKKVKEINELKKKKEEMIARMKVIQDLQGTRSEIVKSMDELVRAVPDGVYLTSYQSRGSQIQMEGFAESNNRISTFMRNLDGSYKFKDSNLTKVKHDDRLGDQGSGFDLQVASEVAAGAVDPEQANAK